MRILRLLPIAVVTTVAAGSGKAMTFPADPVSIVRLPPGGIQPQVAVDAKGVVHVLYFKGEAAHGDLYYAQLSGTNEFSAPIRVNRVAGSAEATGTMRGGHLAVGRDGRIHIAWHGSSLATPRVSATETPVMYTRSNRSRTAFEPERNVVSRHLAGLDGGTVAADADNQVYVAWHAFEPGLRGEADRRVWIARSGDEGETFAEEIAVSPASTGACGCCSVSALSDHRGDVFALYRSATDDTHRDTYLLFSRDHARSFVAARLQEWNIAACPMSSFALSETAGGVLAAWETDGQVQWTTIDQRSSRSGLVIGAPETSKNRKHPVIASNNHGDVLLAWTEGTGWNKGGGLAWQLFTAAGAPTGYKGQFAGVPVWSMGAVASRLNGQFVLVY
jgi:hypothetical protein